MKKASLSGLYAITPSGMDRQRLLFKVEQALKAGTKFIQYRDKQRPAEARYQIAQAIKAQCDHYQALFIINDDVSLALKVKASGVHLGKNDTALDEARRRLSHQIIGVSCYNELDKAVAAQKAGADYVAFGRFFPSKSKPDAIQASLELLHQARSALSIPIVAIGGITPNNGQSLIDAGAHAVAIIDGLFGQHDVYASALQYRNLFNKMKDTK